MRSLTLASLAADCELAMFAMENATWLVAEGGYATCHLSDVCPATGSPQGVFDGLGGFQTGQGGP